MQDMVPGRLYGDNYPLKWISEGRKLLLGIWVVGGETIGRRPLFGRPYAVGHRCMVCRKI